MTTIYTAVKISTTNDTNGNPRRGWYIQCIGDGRVSDGSAVIGARVISDARLGSAVFCGFINEGYRGRAALSASIEPHGIVLDLGEITVTPGEYRTAKRTPFNPDGVQ